MEKIHSIEYGAANNLQYKPTIELVNPNTGQALQPEDLYVTLYIKEHLNEAALFSITGIYNATDEAFDFTFTQPQADQMLPGKWFYGFEVRQLDSSGKVIHRKTYFREHLDTGAKTT